jgi:hypothetical protein
MTGSGRVARLAALARLTEGQLYTAALTLAAALLLLTGLGGVHGVVGTALSQASLPAVPQPTFPPVVVPTAAPGVQGLGALPALEPPPAVGLPLPAPSPEPTFDFLPAPTPSASPSPPAAACTAQPAMDAAQLLLTTLNGPAGGRLPDKDVMGALGLVTGCDPADPAVIAVGLLIGLGHALPDPGLPAPPAAPFVEIPAAVVQALQPARAEIDTVCGLVGTGQTVASLFVWAYPTPVPQLTTQVLFEALGACGQVRQP